MVHLQHTPTSCLILQQYHSLGKATLSLYWWCGITYLVNYLTIRHRETATYPPIAPTHGYVPGTSYYIVPGIPVYQVQLEPYCCLRLYIPGTNNITLFAHKEHNNHRWI